MRKKGLYFGIEVEFFIQNSLGYPVLNSSKIIKTDCLKIDPNINIVEELSSFQIELNPGPWPLSDIGLENCLNELHRQHSILARTVSNKGWVLCETLMPTNITQEIIDNKDFFSKNERCQASANYFSQRDGVDLFSDEMSLHFSGEKIIGCINEIHIHAQLENDEKTINLFNYLNSNLNEIIIPFTQQIEINGNEFSEFNSLDLFNKANGEFNSNGNIRRVGSLPKNIKSYSEYEDIINTFNRIPLFSNDYLDLESTVYFWSRLRGQPKDLRVEFRPLEMGVDWVERVKYLYTVIDNYSKKNLIF